MPITGLEDFVQQLGEQIVSDAAIDLLDDLVEAAPVDTGELQESAYGPIVNGLQAVIGFSAPQADWTDQGAQPHSIDAVNFPVMTFFWANGPNGPGVYSFARVDHPGQEGTHWFSDLVDQWDDYVHSAAEAI